MAAHHGEIGIGTFAMFSDIEIFTLFFIDSSHSNVISVFRFASACSRTLAMRAIDLSVTFALSAWTG